jgi:hypothetical protein
MPALPSHSNRGFFTTKSLFTTKTFWANILMGVLAVAEVLPPEWAAIVIPLVNLGLRYVTTEPVHVIPKSMLG